MCAMNQEVQTEITTQDIVDFNIYHLGRSRASRGPWGCLLVLSLVWLTFLVVGCLRSPHPWETAKAIAPLWSFFPFVLLLLSLRRFGVAALVKRSLGEGPNKGILGPKRVRISPESLQEAGEFQTTATEWAAIQKIAVTPLALYLYNSSVSAFIVPRRCFPNDAAFEEFVRLARQYKADVGR